MNRTESIGSSRGLGGSLGWLRRGPVGLVITIAVLLLAAALLQDRTLGLPTLPLGDWIQRNWDPFVASYGFIFNAIRRALLVPLGAINDFYLWLPWPVWVAVTALAAWRLISWKAAVVFVAGLLFIVAVNLWAEAVQTLSIVTTAMLLTILVGIPVGILVSRNDRLDGILRPVLDGMQTVPVFVYLIPMVMLLGTGAVPAIAASMVFALPPAIRLTNLGLRQVSPDIREAALSFGATSWQLMFKVELPLALRTILAGVNQATMMTVSMVVIAAMVGTPGLGQTVLFALGRVRIGLGIEAGLSILILAIILDRLTQALGKRASFEAERPA